MVAVVDVAVAEEHRGGVGGDERVGPQPAHDLDEPRPQGGVVLDLAVGVAEVLHRREARAPPRRAPPPRPGAAASASGSAAGSRLPLSPRLAITRCTSAAGGGPAGQRAAAADLGVVGVGEHGQGPRGDGVLDHGAAGPVAMAAIARSTSASSTSAWVTRRTSWRCRARPARPGRPGARSSAAGVGQRRRGRCWCAPSAGVDRARPAGGGGLGQAPGPGVVVGQPVDRGRGPRSPAAARIPTWRIPPPRRLRSTRAGRDQVGRARPAASPTGAPSPFDTQARDRGGRGRPLGDGACPEATAAFQSRAPSRCTGRPDGGHRRAGARAARPGRPTSPWVSSTNTAAGGGPAHPGVGDPAGHLGGVERAVGVVEGDQLGRRVARPRPPPPARPGAGRPAAQRHRAGRARGPAARSGWPSCPDGTKSAASLPTRSANAASRRATVGSSPKPSSPTSAVGHRLAHLGRGPGDGVAAQVDAAVGVGHGRNASVQPGDRRDPIRRAAPAGRGGRPRRGRAPARRARPGPARGRHQVHRHRHGHRDGPRRRGAHRRAASSAPGPTTASSARRAPTAPAPAGCAGSSTRSTAPPTTSTACPASTCRSPPRWTGQVVAGVVFDVVRDELFAATLGGGATRDGDADPRRRPPPTSPSRSSPPGSPTTPSAGAARPQVLVRGAPPGPRHPPVRGRRRRPVLGGLRSGRRLLRAGPGRPGTSPPAASSPPRPGAVVTDLGGGPAGGRRASWPPPRASPRRSCALLAAPEAGRLSAQRQTPRGDGAHRRGETAADRNPIAKQTAPDRRSSRAGWAAMTPVAARRAPVTVRTEGAAVVLELSDTLDATVGRALVDAATAAVADAPERLDIDLRKLRSLDARRRHRPGPLPGDLQRPRRRPALPHRPRPRPRRPPRPPTP